MQTLTLKSPSKSSGSELSQESDSSIVQYCDADLTSALRHGLWQLTNGLHALSGRPPLAK